MTLKFLRPLAFMFAFASVALPAAAQDQFSIGPLLDQGPIRFGTGIEIVLNKFDTQIAATGTASAVLHNAQALVTASLPQLKRQFLCEDRSTPHLVFRSIDLGSASLLGDGDLVINAVVHVRECSGHYEGDIGISVPAVVKKSGAFIALSTGPVRLTSNQVYALGGYVGVLNVIVSSQVNAVAGPLITDTVNKLNTWVVGTLRDPGLQKFVRQYNLAISSAQLTMKGSDLVLTVALTGQMSIAEADRRLLSAFSSK